MTIQGAQHVFCTGGSEGIGLELASRTKLDAAVKELRELAKEAGVSGRVFSATADVGDWAQVQAAVAAAEAALGPIDMAFANAGVAIMGTFLEAPVSAFETTNRVNYLGVVHTLKAVLPGMVERRRGRAVVVASLAAFVGMAGFSTYCPTKFALRGLADSLRSELAGTGVAVSIAYPGMTSTAMTADWGAAGRTAAAMLVAWRSEAHATVTQAVRAMLEGLDRGAYILPGPSARNNVLVAATAGAALLAPHVALLAMLFAPLMVLLNQVSLRAADRAVLELRRTLGEEEKGAAAKAVAAAADERRARQVNAFTDCMG